MRSDASVRVKLRVDQFIRFDFLIRARLLLTSIDFYEIIEIVSILRIFFCRSMSAERVRQHLARIALEKSVQEKSAELNAQQLAKQVASHFFSSVLVYYFLIYSEFDNSLKKKIEFNRKYLFLKTSAHVEYLLIAHTGGEICTRTGASSPTEGGSLRTGEDQRAAEAGPSQPVCFCWYRNAYPSMRETWRCIVFFPLHSFSHHAVIACSDSPGIVASRRGGTSSYLTE
jgi:hypothetical protein